MKIPVELSISMKILQIWEPRTTRENGGVQGKELLYSWELPWRKPGTNKVFQSLLEFTLRTAPNQKTFLRCKGRPQSAMKQDHN